MQVSIGVLTALFLSPVLAKEEINLNFIEAIKSWSDAPKSPQSSFLAGTRDLFVSRQLDPNERGQCMTALLGFGGNPYDEGGPLEGHDFISVLSDVTDEEWMEVCRMDKKNPPNTYCDATSLFQNNKIKKICEADPVNGEFETLTMSTICDDGSTFIQNIPFCVFDPCTHEDVILFFSQMPGEDDCILDIRYTGTGGMSCLKETLDLYGLDMDGGNNTETPLSPYFIANALSEEYLSDPEVCDLEVDVDNGILKFDCDAEGIFDKDVEKVCKKMGGDYMEADVAFEYEDTYLGMDFVFDISIVNIPLCNSKECNGGETLGFWDWLMEVQMEVDIHSQVSKIEYCREFPKAKVFVTENKKGNTVEKKCSVLRKSEAVKEVACGQDIAPTGTKLASETCPATCGRCLESPTNEFVLKKEKVDGEIVITVKNCEFLAGKKKRIIKKLCRLNLQTKDISSASAACPDTCGLND